jgi:hypothetical protein|tara:strand:- start:1580 stop:1900 length:321 start_codon:yes stop_codon:yes gene_type:complete
MERQLSAIVGTLPVTGDTINLSISTSADTTSTLTAGQTYQIISDVDCFICESASGTADDAAVTDMPLLANVYIAMTASQGRGLFISAITASGSGTLSVSPRTPANP